VGSPCMVGGGVDAGFCSARFLILVEFVRSAKALLSFPTYFRASNELMSGCREPGHAQAGCGRQVFDTLMKTICTHPGGTTPAPILVFSPHAG